jgi:CheY-like chemotaxis protein
MDVRGTAVAGHNEGRPRHTPSRYGQALKNSAMCGMRILVVDDEPIVRLSVRITLQMDNHSVEVVTSAEEALSRFEIGTYDLIITDYRMGGMTGLQLAERIKARDPGQRIILVSGSPPFPPIDIFDQVILKPFSSEELRTSVAQFAT